MDLPVGSDSTTVDYQKMTLALSTAPFHFYFVKICLLHFLPYSYYCYYYYYHCSCLFCLLHDLRRWLVVCLMTPAGKPWAFTGCGVRWVSWGPILPWTHSRTNVSNSTERQRIALAKLMSRGCKYQGPEAVPVLHCELSWAYSPLEGKRPTYAPPMVL